MQPFQDRIRAPYRGHQFLSVRDSKKTERHNVSEMRIDVRRQIVSVDGLKKCVAGRLDLADFVRAVTARGLDRLGDSHQLCVLNGGFPVDWQHESLP